MQVPLLHFLPYTGLTRTTAPLAKAAFNFYMAKAPLLERVSLATQPAMVLRLSGLGQLFSGSSVKHLQFIDARIDELETVPGQTPAWPPQLRQVELKASYQAAALDPTHLSHALGSGLFTGIPRLGCSIDTSSLQPDEIQGLQDDLKQQASNQHIELLIYTASLPEERSLSPLCNATEQLQEDLE